MQPLAPFASLAVLLAGALGDSEFTEAGEDIEMDVLLESRACLGVASKDADTEEVALGA